MTFLHWALWLWMALMHSLLIERTEAAEVFLLLSDSGRVYQEVADTFAEQLGNAFPVSTTQLDSLTDVELRELDHADNLLVPVGMRAVRRLSSFFTGSAAVLALLVPKSAMEQVNWRSAAVPRVSAVYLDQPVERSLSLIKMMLPEATRVGMLISPENGQGGKSFAREAAERKIKAEVEMTAADGKDLSQALQRLLQQIDVLLLLPDAAVVNENNAQLILVASYRKRVPVFAFSRGMVTAGAVAAVISDPSDVAREGVAMARAWNRGTANLPPARHASGFSLAVNRQVARSLGLSLVSDAEMLRRLRQEN